MSKFQRHTGLPMEYSYFVCFFDWSLCSFIADVWSLQILNSSLSARQQMFQITVVHNKCGL